MIPVYLADDVGAAVQAIIDESGLPKTAYLPDTGLYLQADAGGIALRKAGEKSAVRADFTGGAAHYRRTKGGGELITKAVNHTTKPKIWDATGGNVDITNQARSPVAARLAAMRRSSARGCATSVLPW